MATIEERVAYLEGQMSEYSHSLLQVRDGMRDLADSVRQMGERVGHLEQRLDTRIDTLDEKVSRHFVWLVGMQVTTLVAIVGALLARG